jgi:DNA-binding ferritin-like protein
MEFSAVSQSHEKSENERVWRELSEAGLIDILPDEVAERIKEAKHVVMGRLGELLELTTDIEERESAAISLATLKEVERTVSRGRRSSD